MARAAARRDALLPARLAHRHGLRRSARRYLPHRRWVGVVPGRRADAARVDGGDEWRDGRSAEDDRGAGLPLHDDVGSTQATRAHSKFMMHARPGW